MLSSTHIHGAAPQALVQYILAHAASGLQYMHAQGIVHGDLHAGNVLLFVEGVDSRQHMEQRQASAGGGHQACRSTNACHPPVSLHQWTIKINGKQLFYLIHMNTYQANGRSLDCCFVAAVSLTARIGTLLHLVKLSLDINCLHMLGTPSCDALNARFHSVIAKVCKLLVIIYPCKAQSWRLLACLYGACMRGMQVSAGAHAPSPQAPQHHYRPMPA